MQARGPAVCLCSTILNMNLCHISVTSSHAGPAVWSPQHESLPFFGCIFPTQAGRPAVWSPPHEPLPFFGRIFPMQAGGPAVRVRDHPQHEPRLPLAPGALHVECCKKLVLVGHAPCAGLAFSFAKGEQLPNTRNQARSLSPAIRPPAAGCCSALCWTSPPLSRAWRPTHVPQDTILLPCNHAPADRSCTTPCWTSTSPQPPAAAQRAALGAAAAAALQRLAAAAAAAAAGLPALHPRRPCRLLGRLEEVVTTVAVAASRKP